MELTAVISVCTPHSSGSCYLEHENPIVALHFLLGYTSQLLCDLPRAGNEGLTPQKVSSACCKQACQRRFSICVIQKLLQKSI